MKKTNHRRRGFSLVEVALALLVISVGMVALMGLLPGGLDNSKRASDESQQALFADYVFNYFRAYSMRTNATWSSVDTVQIPVAATDMWVQNPKNVVSPNSGFPIVLVPIEDQSKAIQEIIIWYNLQITPVGNDIKHIRLQTFSGTDTKSNTNSAKVFLADIYKGSMPP